MRSHVEKLVRRRPWEVAALVAASLLLLGSAPINATEVIHVLPGQSIQAAVNAAPEGSVVVLPAGESFAEHLVLCKAITLRGGNPITPSRLTPVYRPYEILELAGRITASVKIRGSIRAVADGVHIENLVILGSGTVIAVVSGSTTILNCNIQQGTSGLVVASGARASLLSSVVWYAVREGVRVEPDGSLSARDSGVFMNGGAGLVVSGRADIEGCFIAYNGLDLGGQPRDESEEAAGSSNAHGITVVEGMELALSESHILGNCGFGVAAVDLSWDSLTEPSCRITGSGNVVLASTDPFGNRRGALSPDPADIVRKQYGTDAVPWDWNWPMGFRAREFSLEVAFGWWYRSKCFALDAELSVPLADWGGGGGVWPGRRGRMDVLHHYSNVTSLRIIAEELLRMASEEGYGPLATASFILGFVNANIRYDHDRAEHDEPGFQLPVQTLVMKSGVCRDTAALTAVLLHLTGFEAAYVSLSPPNDDSDGHAVAGVAVDGAWGTSLEREGRLYYLAETGSVEQGFLERGGEYEPSAAWWYSSFEFGDVDLRRWGSPIVDPVVDSPDVVTEVCWFGPDDERQGVGTLRVVNTGSAEARNVRLCYWWDNSCDSDAYCGVKELICDEPMAVGDLAPGEWREFVISADGAPPSVVQRTAPLSVNSWDWERLYVQVEFSGIVNTEDAHPGVHLYQLSDLRSQCP